MCVEENEEDEVGSDEADELVHRRSKFLRDIPVRRNDVGDHQQRQRHHADNYGGQLAEQSDIKHTGVWSSKWLEMYVREFCNIKTYTCYVTKKHI